MLKAVIQLQANAYVNLVLEVLVVNPDVPVETMGSPV